MSCLSRVSIAWLAVDYFHVELSVFTRSKQVNMWVHVCTDMCANFELSSTVNTFNCVWMLAFVKSSHICTLMFTLESCERTPSLGILLVASPTVTYDCEYLPVGLMSSLALSPSGEYKMPLA